MYQFAFLVFFPTQGQRRATPLVVTPDKEDFLKKLGQLIEDRYKGPEPLTHPWMLQALDSIDSVLADHFRSGDKRFCFYVATHTTLIDYTRAVIVASSNPNVFVLSAIEPGSTLAMSNTVTLEQAAKAGDLVGTFLKAISGGKSKDKK